MTKLFHEIAKSRLEDVRLHGIKLGYKGAKRDSQIEATDDYLSNYIPESLRDEGVDRRANIYCYLPDGSEIIDITSDERKLPSDIAEGSQQAMLELEVDASKCYVSDLDLYDKVKQVLHEGNKSEAKRLAKSYWSSLQPLTGYNSEFRRPEVMVTYSLSPSAIVKIY